MKRKHRLSIATLMGVVLIAALVLAALRHPGETWGGVFLLLTGAVLMLAVVGAVCRRGNERAWWQNQGIEPLVVAATLWARTHTVAPADAEIVGDRDLSPGTNTHLNGHHFDNGAAAGADGRRNDETKPIRGPEAE